MSINNYRLRKILLQELGCILILIVIGTLISYMFCGNKLWSLNTYLKAVFYDLSIGLSIWKGNQLLWYLLNKKFPWDINPKTTLLYHILTSIVFTAIDIIIVNYLIFTYFFHKIILNDLRHIIYYASVEFGIATTVYFIRMFKFFWRESIIQKEKFKYEALSMQYETLKSYVNPHFLFNSLYVLSSLIDKDREKSQEFIMQLSEIYQYVLEQKGKELVPLETELNFLTSYIRLHRIMHSENLKVVFKIDDKSGHIIPLSIQTLIENAIKHNIITAERPLEVTIERDNSYIVVQNRMQSRSTLNQTGHLGLNTIIKRYEFFTKKPLLVSTDYSFFTVKVPILS